MGWNGGAAPCGRHVPCCAASLARCARCSLRSLCRPRSAECENKCIDGNTERRAGSAAAKAVSRTTAPSVKKHVLRGTQGGGRRFGTVGQFYITLIRAVVPLCPNWSLCKMSRPLAAEPRPPSVRGGWLRRRAGSAAAKAVSRTTAPPCVRGGWLRRAGRLPCRPACPSLRGGGSPAAACGFGLSVRAVLFVICAARSVA